jgi:acyl dehydratase
MTTDTTTSQRYWDDVQVGDELPGYELPLTWTRMAAQVSGSQDFYPVHHDPDFARAGGHRDIFYNTGFTRAALSRLLTDWIGPQGWLRKLGFEMRRMNRNGDTIRLRGEVMAKRESTDPRGHEIDIDLWIENDREGRTTPARAVVQLPSRPA